MEKSRDAGRDLWRNPLRGGCVTALGGLGAEDGGDVHEGAAGVIATLPGVGFFGVAGGGTFAGGFVEPTEVLSID